MSCPHVDAQVAGQLPCVAVDRDGEIEIVIGHEALRGCKGDFSVFEHLLEQQCGRCTLSQRPTRHESTATFRGVDHATVHGETVLVPSDLGHVTEYG